MSSTAACPASTSSRRGALDRTAEAADASAEDLEDLRTDDEALLRLADRMVENVVGVISCRSGSPPTSSSTAATTWCPWPPRNLVVAAASNLAAVAREHGGFFARRRPGR